MHHAGANKSSVQDWLKPFMRDHITMWLIIHNGLTIMKHDQPLLTINNQRGP